MPIPLGVAVGTTLGSSLLGGMGGKAQAKAASRPTRFSETSTLTPYSPGSNQYLDWYLGQAYDAANQYPDLSPDLSRSEWERFSSGGGGGGVGIPSLQSVLGTARGLGVGGIGANRIKKFQVDLRPEHQALIGGDYLNADNPELEAVLGNVRREAMEDFGRSLPAVTAQFGSPATGRYGAGLQQDAVTKATEEFHEGLGGTIANARLANYEAERDRMVQGLQIAAQLDASGRSDLAANIRSKIAARAQLLSTALGGYLGLLGSVNAANVASRDRRDIASLDAAFRLDEAQNRADMGDINALTWLGEVGLPIFGNYGTRSTQGVQQGPRLSSTGGFLQGAAGTGLGTFGLMKDMGIGGKNQGYSPYGPYASGYRFP